MTFLSEETFNIVRNKETIDIFEKFGDFIYKEALRNRAWNKPLIEAEERYREEVSLEILDEIWGKISSYAVSSEIDVEAYAIPPLNSKLYDLPEQ
jgi:glucose-6-phosphate-specific signal transduction histidine kinase